MRLPVWPTSAMTTTTGTDPKLSFDDRTKVNYDHPDSLETSLLIAHLAALAGWAAGRAARAYDFTTHLRSGETVVVAPGPGRIGGRDPRLG
jgi:uridine kinase